MDADVIPLPGSAAHADQAHRAELLAQERALRIELAALKFANTLASRRQAGLYKVPLGAMNAFRRELGMEELT